MVAEHVAQHQDRPLAGWKVLQGGDERQGHGLLRLVARLRPGRGLREPLEQRVGIRLEPQRLPSASGLRDLEREPRDLAGAPPAVAEHVQAAVGRDAV